MLNDTPIYDITPFTLLDYPEHVGCIVWFSGCNMRCSYCYNPDIVFSTTGRIHIDSLLNFLKDRKGRVEAVILSGGEATSYKKLPELCEVIKNLGYKIKLDTNGSNPKMLQKLLEKDLLDYVALDYKAPHSKFNFITKNNNFDALVKSLDLLLLSYIDYEVRTTLHSDLLNEDDVNKIILDLHAKGYKKQYFLQKVQLNARMIEDLQIPQTKFDLSLLDQKIEIGFRAF